MILTFTQGHNHTRQLDLCNNSIVKWHAVANSFVMVDYVREMTAKESCQYGEYESFEHLLFLFSSWVGVGAKQEQITNL